MKKLLFIIALLTGLSASAQETKVIEALKHLRQAYGKDAIAFDLKYIYSNEDKPGVVLDSLAGSIEMEGSKYRCLLDSVETIQNDKYNIVLFKEDQLMYLSTGVSASASMDPLVQLDSMFKKAAPQRCAVSTAGRIKILDIGFGENAVCKTMKLTIDTVKQHLLSVDYIVKSSMLTGVPEDSGYAAVKSVFYNYRTLKTDPSRFDEKRFFRKEGDEFVPVAAYNNYKIVVATPKL